MNVTRGSVFALVLLVGIAVIAPGTTAASGSSGKSGFLKVTKECSEHSGQAGAFCTITSSNIREIKVGSKIFYGEAGNVLPGMLDSNVVLDVAEGNKAVGRCTLEFATMRGLCTFADGTGRFAGFAARIDVSSQDGVNWLWVGTYEFESVGIRWPRHHGR